MTRSRRGFTLVEMLVVIGIIGTLAALLLPAVMMAVNSARRAAIAVEISELSKSIESYREKHDDYPPNFRDYNAFIRHVNKCYRKGAENTAHMNAVIGVVWPGYSLANPPIPAAGQPHIEPMIDEGESLVFWLYLVDKDKREPFKALLSTTPLLAATSQDRLFPFKEERFVDGPDADYIPAYKAIHSGESAYLYIDNRSYDELTEDYANPLNRAAFAADVSAAGYTRPYWSEDRASTNAALPMWQQFKPKNPTSFQIIGAGQDGESGVDPPALALPERAVKFFPGGGGPYQPADNDNMTNFSEGRLEDKLP